MQVGNSLLEQGHLQPVGLKSRNSAMRRNTFTNNVFCDGDNALYRFVSTPFYLWYLLSITAAVFLKYSCWLPSSYL